MRNLNWLLKFELVLNQLNMNQIAIYQHPYVDVFKVTKLNEWSTCHKEGDVEQLYDKSLAKTVLKIGGATSASNYVQVPASKNLPKQSLGLIGKYIYVCLNVAAGKHFVMHFDYMIQDSRVVRISVSNLYKEFKNNNGTSLQVPLENVPAEKWTYVSINALHLLEENKCFAANISPKFYLRSFQVHSAVQVKGVYTSDILYSAMTLPKDMALRQPKDKDWFSLYHWVQIPETESAIDSKENKQMNKDLVNVKPALKGTSTHTPRGLKKAKGVTFDGDASMRAETESVSSKTTAATQRPNSAASIKSKGKIQTKKPAKTEVTKKQKEEAPEEEKVDERSPEEIFKEEARLAKEKAEAERLAEEARLMAEKKANMERTSKEIAEIKSAYDMQLESKHIKQQAEVTLYQEQSVWDQNKTQRKNSENFILRPSPILGLDRIVGVNPNFTARSVFFNKDAKLAREILYCQANVMLGYHPEQQKQRLFLDHQLTNIEKFEVLPGYALTFCRQQTNANLSNKRQGPQAAEDIMVTIWDLEEVQKSLFSFRPPLSQVKNCSLSNDQTSIMLNGKDFQGRELILVYSWQDLIKHQKIEILARQLSDFDLVSVRFNDVLSSSLVGCGFENIRFFKIKNKFLPSQLVALNNTARGKVFNNSTTMFKIDEQKGKRMPVHVFVTTTCGLLYMVNFFTRQVDKIIQIHDGPVQVIKMAPPASNKDLPSFFLTSSQEGNLRIWNTDFSKLVSEVAINQEVTGADINVDANEIAVMSKDGTLSLLELDQSSFRVIMRSHQEDIVGVAHNLISGCLVSIGKDSSVKVWLAETMDQVHEFNTSSHDPPVTINSSNYNDEVAVGFKSGFLRIFNLTERKMVHETMIFESPVMNIAFSDNGKFMAVFHKNAKIVIFNLEKEYTPVKNIDYEFPNSNYFSLSFSPDGTMLANISSNANTITVWETKNFSLKWFVDLTGEIISKIIFAPNGRDLLVMTTSSKLKVLRVDHQISERMETVRDQYGMSDQECTDFWVTANGKFIIVAGTDGFIRVYDYFLRGQVVASQQAFSGHLTFPQQIFMQKDMRYLYSVGPGNGIYKWAFWGDKEVPHDLTTQYEKTQGEIDREKVGTDEDEFKHPIFDKDKLETYTEQQLADMRNQIVKTKEAGSFKPTASSQIKRSEESLHLLQDGGLSLKRRPKIEYTPEGYVFEQHCIHLEKVLGCSIYPKVKNNLLWAHKHHYIAYTMQNIIIFEDLNTEKTQMLKREVNDIITELKMSPSGDLMLAYTKVGTLDGFPQVIVWDAKTRKKISQIAIDDSEIISVEFSNYSNMLLVISGSTQDNQYRSTVAVYDFLEGRRDFLSKSVLPMKILDARWNPYIKELSDEFVTISDRKYHYWRIRKTLHMEYQEGCLPPEGSAVFKDGTTLTALSFVEPMIEQNSVYLLIGLSNGYVWTLDTRTNFFLHKSKVIDCPINRIISTVARIIIEGREDTKIHSWDLNKTIGDFHYDARDPDYFFAGKENLLSLDGFPSSSCYDTTAAEAIVISTGGSFWLLNFIECVTVKLKSCHDPSYPLQAIDFKYVTPNEFKPAQQNNSDFYEFDQNYIIGSSGKDGIIKVWNMFDMDHLYNFILPKEECSCIAMHQFKPYMVVAATDGYIRFFDVQSSKSLGRCQVWTAQEEDAGVVNDYVTHMRILPSGQHILCATKNGQIILIFVEAWIPLSITLQNLVSLNTAVNGFDVSFLEPYNKWLTSTANGKVIVYNRQDGNSFKQELFEKNRPPTFIYMDSFNVQEYVDNCFTETKKTNTLDHFYSLAKRNLVKNEVAYENETEAIFLNNDLASYICYVRKCPALFIRNFELHQVVKKIDLDAQVLSLEMTPGSAPYVFMISADNSIKMLDFVNEANHTRIETIHDEVKAMKVCPNGRYVMTSGDKGDVIIWAVRRERTSQVVETLQANP